MKRAILASIILLLFFNENYVSAQVVINEFVPANVDGFKNSNGETDDWIELYNDGSSTVNLQGYGLSDDPSKPYHFKFPSYILDPDEYVIVFAADTNNSILVDHFETAVNANTTWRYFAGTSQPDTNWRNLSFNDGSWSTGNGGIGYGDGDDQKVISTSSRSVMMRKEFIVPDTSEILKAIFNIDYDDGFVAFLNGVEIARANLGVVGDRPMYNDLAISSHEAEMYQGNDPDSFFIDPGFLKTILIQGNNVLAVEVHNTSSSSNDLSAIPFLTFGMKTSATTFSSPPSWFNEPGNEYFCAKFKLSRAGSTIYLTNPSGSTVDQKSYTNMQPDDSWGRKPDGANNWCLIKTPTPLTTNNSSTCYSGYAIQPIFSIGPGFYSSSQNLTLTNTTPGGVIRYTTNGDEPTSSSRAYSSQIHLSSSKTIRARVFASGYLPSQIITNTYVIDDDIHLPVFCITTDSANLWDYNDGIYVMGPNAESNSPYRGANFWQDWRKQASIEYYDKAKNRIFNFDADIKIYGNYSRSKPQKSMEIILESKYGVNSLDYSFYPDKPQINKVNNLVLRNAGTDWNEVHFRDAFMQRVLKNSHTGYLGTEPAVMYLNGSYWGVFTIHENHDHHWIENNFNLDEDEIDYMVESGSDIDVKNGDDNTFWDSYNYATTTNPSSSQYYNTMDSYWDLDNYKDYFIAETYYNNGDWIGDWTNNIKLWRPHESGGKLRYLVYDLDFGCGGSGSYSDNRLATAIYPAANCNSSNMFRSMLNNAKFKREFINRYADLINTIFKPSEMIAVMRQFQDSMSFDMAKHFAKWGSSMSGWTSRINSMKSFINNRPSVARDHIESQFNLNRQVTLTFNVSPSGAGRIQVSTIVPSSYPWTGVYFNGNPVTITAIPNPGYTFDRFNSNHAISNDHNQTTTYDFSNSTESITAYFSGSSQPASLTVSEFNYNSSSTLDPNDWIELHNYGSDDLDISGWKIKDENDYESYTFPVGTVIGSHGYLVVASDLDQFSDIFPTVNNVVGPTTFQLSNGGDQIRVFDAYDQQVLSFYFQDVSPWPIQADGQGFTCELNSSTANLNDGNSWFPGCIGGSPGRSYSSGLSTNTHIAGNTAFCPGGYTVLTVNSTPGYSYHWQRNYFDIPNATDTSYSTNQSGSYTVRVINQGCSSISDTLIVNQVSTGQPPVASSVSRCGEGTIILSATAPDSIYWFDAPNGNLLGAGTTFTTPTISTTTTYYAQTSLSCPSAAVSIDAIVNQVTATPIVADINRCGPGATVLNAIDTAVVNWYNAPVGGGQVYSGNIFVTGYISHDTTFYAEAGSVCISERIPVNVSITSSAPPIVNAVSRCGSGPLVLTASSLAPVFWYDSIIGGNQVGSGVNYLTPMLTETRTYYAESNNGCASARVPARAIINEVPDPPVGFDSTHCGNGSVSLFATSAVQIFWYNTQMGGTSIGSGSYFNTPNLTSDSVFYAESYDVCTSIRTPIHARIDPLPPSPVGSNAQICGNGAAYLSANASNPIYWFAQATGSPVLGTGNNFTTPLLSQTAIYYAVAITNCSSLPTPVTAFVSGIPTPNLGNDITIQSGTSTVIEAGTGYDTYLWSTGETTQSITINSTGDYSVIVSLDGCTGTDTITVTVVLGIQEASTLNASLHLFPNPVKDNLTIQLESSKSIPAKISVLDITGKELYSDDIKLIGGLNTHTIGMSGFASGVYLISIRSNDFMKTMSFIVE